MAGRSTDISSARRGLAINLGADTAMSATRGVYVGVAGDVKVDFADGGTGVVMKAAATGEHPWQVTKIYSTANGTAATDIVALW